MMRKVYSAEGVVTAELDEAENIIVIEHLSMSADQILEENCLAVLEEVKKGVDAVIIDVSKSAGVPTQARQLWFKDVLNPQFSQYGLKVLITVIPTKSALTKLASKKWIKAAVPFDFEMFEVSTLKDAKNVIEKTRAKQTLV